MISVHIVKKFPDFTLRVDFDGENEVIGLLGASGCGKSMTLQCIAGIIKPDHGRIVVDDVTLFDSDKKINLPPQKRKVGLLFQNYALFPNMTVRENVAAGLHKMSNSVEKQTQIDQLLRQFHLEEIADHYPSAISGGQAQRTALARILGAKPGILMLDEPFTALDDYLRWEVERELKEVLKDFSGTVLFVSHNREEVYRLCHKVCTMSHGKTEALVSVKELFANPKTKAAALISGCKNIFSAKKTQEDQILLPELSLKLKFGQNLPDTLQFVGLRSHHLKLSAENTVKDNSIIKVPCQVMDVTEDVFSYIVLVRPDISPKDSPLIRVDLSKVEWENLQQKKNLLLEISTEQILLLN